MKHIKNFSDYILLEYVNIHQGANLATNSTPLQSTFDGGDGPSAMSEIKPIKHTVKDTKKIKGDNAKEKQEEDKRKRKKLARKYKIYSMSKKLTHSDPFGNNGQGNSPSGGGADYVLQGF